MIVAIVNIVTIVTIPNNSDSCDNRDNVTIVLVVLDSLSLHRVPGLALDCFPVIGNCFPKHVILLIPDFYAMTLSFKTKAKQNIVL